MTTTNLITARAGRHLLAQDEQAARTIDQVLAATGNRVDTPTARLIAACVHPGNGSALQRFAASGRLRLSAALSEIPMAFLTEPIPGWAEALWHYLEDRERRAPTEALRPALLTTERY